MRLRAADELNHAHLMMPPDVAGSGSRSA